MKNIQNAQSKLVNDTCNDCGSFIDVGAIIDEHDTVLELAFSGAEALKRATDVKDKAANRFTEVNYSLTTSGNEVKLALTFSFTAEKMIFQLENGL
ncbi:DUF406 family protein [Shewanella youngdeokensis]|uniref:DUF406 family protein n=1 Tax=Shewanella youngdeokensis TaxID=2999068 RepID=A0ABZ0K3T1_9GAMM|nr:DUF406 family protein [Shewanella sp. DAU334]